MNKFIEENNHSFEKHGDEHITTDYFKCKICGLLAYKNENRGRLVPLGNDVLYTNLWYEPCSIILISVIMETDVK